MITSLLRRRCSILLLLLLGRALHSHDGVYDHDAILIRLLTIFLQLRGDVFHSIIGFYTSHGVG